MTAQEIVEKMGRNLTEEQLREIMGLGPDQPIPGLEEPVTVIDETGLPPLAPIQKEGSWNFLLVGLALGALYLMVK